MTTVYNQVDTELLNQMMQVARRNPETPAEQIEALHKAVEERKKQLLDQLADLAKQHCKDSEAIRLNARAQLALYPQLILLEPDNYQYYEQAGKCAHFADDYAASAANYTSALQLVGEDTDKLCDLYKERSRAYLYARNYSSTLADGKMFLRYKYLSKEHHDTWRRQKFYNLYMICESLRQLGNQVLGDLIEITYELAELSDEGVTDELIEDYCHLLDIPLDTHGSGQGPASAPARSPLSRFNELKQQIPTEPREAKKWRLRKQFYEEHEYKANPDFSLLHQIMQEFIRFEPTYYRYHATIGGLYFEQKNYQAAIPHLTKALALVDQFPGNSQWRQYKRGRDIFRLQRMLGWIYYKLRQYRTAVKHYALAIRADPEHEDTTQLMSMFVKCFVRPGEGSRLRALERCFRKAFPDREIEGLNWMEEVWADTSRGAFVQFSRAGIELGRSEHVDRQSVEAPDSLTTSQEQTEKQQQQAQRIAETLKHLEELLRF